MVNLVQQEQEEPPKKNRGGAPKGNTNAAKSGMWRQTLDRAIAQDDGKRLRRAAERLLTLAAKGEQWAVKELGDRLDGKCAQMMTLMGDPNNPLEFRKRFDFGALNHLTEEELAVLETALTKLDEATSSEGGSSATEDNLGAPAPVPEAKFNARQKRAASIVKKADVT